MFHKRLLILFLIFANYTYAQTITPEDSLQIQKLLKIAKDSIYENTNKSIKIANQILELSNKKNYYNGIIKANSLFGTANYILANFQKSIDFHQKAIDICREKNYQEELSKSLNNISSAYVALSNYEKALSSCYESLTIRLKKNDSLGIAKCYQQLADCFFRKKDLQKALLYSDKAIKLLKQLNLQQNCADALRLKGLVLLEEKKYDLAFETLVKAKAVSDSIGDNIGLLIVNIDIAGIYFQEKKYDSAEIAYINLLKMPELEFYIASKFIVLHNLGSLYLETNKLIQSEKYLMKSLIIAKQLNNNDYLQLVYGTLSELYFKKGDYKQAYIYKEHFIAFSDSVMNNEKMKAIEELTVTFETKEITEQNKLLQIESKLDKAEVKQKKLLLLLVSLFIGIVAVFVVFFIRKNKEKNRRKNNKLKLELLLSQMNPHFIFNSVDNIQTLIYNNQNTDAVKYLGKFSKLTRQILENSRETYITLSEEISMLENYLSIQQLLYNNKFDFNLIVSDTIDQDSILVPPMLTQPFIENAIKHGVNDIESRGLITVNYSFSDEKLFFEIVDNGKGIDLNKKQTNHKSLAMNITKERFAIYSENKNFKINIENCINTNGNIIGAKVYFEIPYIYEK